MSEPKVFFYPWGPLLPCPHLDDPEPPSLSDLSRLRAEAHHHDQPLPRMLDAALSELDPADEDFPPLRRMF